MRENEGRQILFYVENEPGSRAFPVTSQFRDRWTQKATQQREKTKEAILVRGFGVARRWMGGQVYMKVVSSKKN